MVKYGSQTVARLEDLLLGERMYRIEQVAGLVLVKRLAGLRPLVNHAAIPAAAVGKEADFFTLEFNAADTMVAGRTNCNRFFGKYELKGKELELKNLGMTRMACPDMQYEDAFVKMLDEVDRFEIKGAELTLFDDHKALAVFKAVEKEPAKQ